MVAHEEKFFNRENLELLVEMRTLHSKFIYHGEHNAPTEEEMSRMQEIAQKFKMHADEFYAVSKELFTILKKLKVQGVNGVDYSTPEEQQS